ncbi:lytic transglycosylase domain-containing protein [Chelativorans sp.]|uniref:lytic transglycosylase domain-containing protein n=1 Tax=Chelativorans sp. TaxID=2203393 RepID=UPI0028111FCA|nr:lytic transglycosylase domain-containing protein [Chelativorans sp.]
MPATIRAIGLCAFLSIPLLAGCSAAGDSTATLALTDAGTPGQSAAGEGDPEIVGKSLAAEQDAEISGVTALATPTPRPQREAVAAVEAIAEGKSEAAPAPKAAAALPGVKEGEEPVAAVAYADPGRKGRLAAVSALEQSGKPRPVAARSPELDALIARYAAHYGVPERLVRRVVKRESNFNPAARNRIYWGLMQIRHDTAQTMGYRGPAHGLLDAETNLKYAVKYLRGAYITAGGNEDRAVRFYAAGYYYDAKRKGLLKETGLRN